MRASKDAKKWEWICQLTFRPGWIDDPKTVKQVQRLALKFGGSKRNSDLKKDVVVVSEGKETVYPTLSEAAKNVPLSVATIHKYIDSGKTTMSGYSFYFQNRDLLEA